MQEIFLRLIKVFLSLLVQVFVCVIIGQQSLRFRDQGHRINKDKQKPDEQEDTECKKQSANTDKHGVFTSGLMFGLKYLQALVNNRAFCIIILVDYSDCKTFFIQLSHVWKLCSH